MNYVKIGDQWYLVTVADGKTTLAPHTFAEGEAPADGFTDGDAILAEADSLELVDFRNLAVEAQAAFTAARDAAAKSGSPADIATMRTAQARFLVLNNELTERATAISSALGDTEVPEVPQSATQPNETTQPAGKPAGTESTTTESTESTEGGTESTEGAPDAAMVEMVAASAAKAVSMVLGGVQAGAGRPSPRVVPNGAVNLSELAGGGTQVVVKAEAARVIAAAGTQVLDTGAEMDDDKFLEAFRDFESGFRGTQVQAGGAKATIARYQVFPADGVMVDRDAPEAFRAVRASAAGTHPARVHADGSSCDSCVTSPDVRRAIPDTLLDEDPLGSLFQTYAAPHCELKYYKALSLADIDTGITVWDDAAATAFCDARDAWYASVTAGTPDPQLYADMKAAEKTCAIPSCAPTDTVKSIGVSACLRYPVEMEHCNAELIPAYRRALNTAFTQKLNQRRMAQVEQYNIPVTVDAEAAPFVNADGDSLGAALVAMEVAQSLIARGVMAERIAAGNYVAIVPYSFMTYLMSDDLKTVDKAERALSSYLGVPVVTVYEYGDGDGGAVQSLAGKGGPFVFNSLPLSVKDGGTANAYASLAWPTSWKMHLLDPSDFFQVTRPEIMVGAQVTPDDAVQNMVFGMFQETFFGIGKDGNHPSWTVDFTNLRNNGARVAGIRPVGAV